MKIYFGFTVAGDRSSIGTAQRIVELMEGMGHEVLTKHLVRDDVWDADRLIGPQDVYNRDMKWLQECDLFIAEVSGSSFGLGFETGYLLGATRKRAVLFYRREVETRISLLELENPPSARNGMMGAFVEDEDRFIIFGGSGSVLLNEVWELRKAPAASTQVIVGYGRVQPESNRATPAGLAILGYRQDGILITETSVLATPALREGRIHAEVDGPVNTGIALANPNTQAAVISFFFTDLNGQNTATSTTTIPPNGQIARFLHEPPFNAPRSFRGSLTFAASLPVAATALRGFTNERSEFLVTTLPVVQPSLGRSEPVLFSDVPSEVGLDLRYCSVAHQTFADSTGVMRVTRWILVISSPTGIFGVLAFNSLIMPATLILLLGCATVSASSILGPERLCWKN